VAKQREQQVERVRPRRLLEKKYVGERVEGRENEVDVLRRGAHLSSDERHQLHRELVLRWLQLFQTNHRL
jgi:hypothetical protein